MSYFVLLCWWCFLARASTSYEAFRPEHTVQGLDSLMLAQTRALALRIGNRSLAGQAIDSHIHLWTADKGSFPMTGGTFDPPSFLEAAGEADKMRTVMLDAGVRGALVVQPACYGQDHSYIEEAGRRYPTFFKGMMSVDPSIEDPVATMRQRTAAMPNFYVGVRFNPFSWVDGNMSDHNGHLLYAAAGELRLPVGFMPFQGLKQHEDAIESLIAAHPSTQVIIDHWGFFVQPATGKGDRSVDENNWDVLLRFGRSYPQVHVKLSGMQRNALDLHPFTSLENRLNQLIQVFSTKRLMWGSDAPFFLEFGNYSESLSLRSWALWSKLNTDQQDDLLRGTAERLFGHWGA